MKQLNLSVAVMLFSGAVSADGIQITGTISQNLKTPVCEKKGMCTMASFPSRSIKLLKISLSEQKKEALFSGLQQRSNHAGTSFTSTASVSSQQLGMGKVPVLDQGVHGTCVVFASTAALDAAMEQGDNISQLCQLQLGNYLSENGYGPSGWYGSFGPAVLSQMESYGIVSRAVEASQGCAGYTAYPAEAEEPQNGMTLTEYHRLSEPLPDGIGWSPVLDVNDAFEGMNGSVVLQQVKAILNKGDRLTFGVLLFDFDKGLVGAVGRHHSTYDTWVLTPELINDLQQSPEFGGHEMVITGFDDNAVATDDKGRKHTGLLTLRNSWGNKLGDKGNFYMSYDYFKNLVVEVQRIRSSN